MDGNDVIAVREVVGTSTLKRPVRVEGPTLIEAVTYRLFLIILPPMMPNVIGMRRLSKAASSQRASRSDYAVT